MLALCDYANPRMFAKRRNPHHGTTIQLPDDLRYYDLQVQQRWRPHLVEERFPIAQVGDLVTFESFMAKWVGVTIGIVNRTRTIRQTRTSMLGVRQVELMGMPCRWFGIGLFEEYRENRKSLRIRETELSLGA